MSSAPDEPGAGSTLTGERDLERLASFVSEGPNWAVAGLALVARGEGLSVGRRRHEARRGGREQRGAEGEPPIG